MLCVYVCSGLGHALGLGSVNTFRLRTHVAILVHTPLTSAILLLKYKYNLSLTSDTFKFAEISAQSVYQSVYRYLHFKTKSQSFTLISMLFKYNGSMDIGKL